VTEEAFTLFEVVLKPGMESTFNLGDLVAASTSITAENGQMLYFCVTVQPGALRTQLASAPEVQSFREL
jgi:hypothetical protein